MSLPKIALAPVLPIVLMTACGGEAPRDSAESSPEAITAAPFVSVQTFGGPRADAAYALATDASGNLVVVGTASGTVDFGSGPLSGGYSAMFIAKYSPSGACLWAKLLSSGITPRAVAVSPGGAIFVTGAFIGTVDFGGGPTSSVGWPVVMSEDAFVARYAPDGTYRWASTFGGGLDDWGRAITMASNGDLLVAGQLAGSVDFGCGRMTSNSDGIDVFLIRYTRAGACVWAKLLGGTFPDVGSGVAEDAASGNVLVTGSFWGTADFGAGSISSNGPDVFVAGYSGAGSPIWSRGFGGSGSDGADALALDPSGNVVIGGHIQGVVDFGGGPVGSDRVPAGFVTKLSPSGAHLWSRGEGGPGQTMVTGVSANASGAVFVSGGFRGTASFGGDSFTADPNSWDAFVAKYAPGTGAHRWSQGFGGTADDLAEAIGFDAAGYPVAVGYFGDTVDFGAGPVTSAGPSDAFVLTL